MSRHPMWRARRSVLAPMIRARSAWGAAFDRVAGALGLLLLGRMAVGLFAVWWAGRL